MTEIIVFIFSSFWTWLGAVILVASFCPIKITLKGKKDD